jgi:hypothetical protein
MIVNGYAEVMLVHDRVAVFSDVHAGAVAAEVRAAGLPAEFADKLVLAT